MTQKVLRIATSTQKFNAKVYSVEIEDSNNFEFNNPYSVITTEEDIKTPLMALALGWKLLKPPGSTTDSFGYYYWWLVKD